MPRTVQVGPVTLDLFHRDALVGDAWVGLHPREFEVLWRLSETPEDIVMRTQLLKDVWRLDHDPETNRVEVNISRIRAKLHPFKLSWIVVTGDTGGYRLSSEAAVKHELSGNAAEDWRVDAAPALDSSTRFGNEGKTPTAAGDKHAISEKRPGLD